MNTAYIKFDDIDFLSKTYKGIAEEILREVLKMELCLSEAEELYESAKQKFGEEKAKGMYKNYITVTSKTLAALKITFWYYTGYSTSRVIIDNATKQDIFNITKRYNYD